ncbi:MAG: hypothetical protein R2822_13850 [Spirosomataceae bacterium]
MTLPTGVQSIAENNYGRPDQALGYLQRMTRAFGYALPGSMYEVSPDYGMFAQAWTLYSYAIPLVKQFFGVRSVASKKQVRIQPQMPTAWDKAQLKDITVGNNRLDVQYNYMEGALKMNIAQTQSDWQIQWAFPHQKYKSWQINGKEGVSKTNRRFRCF